jgi:hypothetical protein
MSDNYSKVGKFYNLTSTTDVSIPGAGLLHGLYNGANASATVTVDGTYALHIPIDNGVTFPNPVAFSRIKTSTSTIVVLYS